MITKFILAKLRKRRLFSQFNLTKHKAKYKLKHPISFSNDSEDGLDLGHLILKKKKLKIFLSKRGSLSLEDHAFYDIDCICLSPEDLEILFNKLLPYFEEVK